MKNLLPILFAVSLFLTACGGGNNPTPEEIQSSEAQALVDSLDEAFPSEGVAPKNDAIEVKAGDDIPITCYSHRPCDGTLSLETVTLSDKCLGRVDSYGIGPELEPGKTYLQIEALFDYRSGTSSWTMLNDPQIIDKDGLTQDVEMTVNCHEDGEYRLWSSTLDQGQKAKYFGAWIVPEDSEVALLHNAKIQLPRVDSSPEIDDNAEASDYVDRHQTSTGFVEENELEPSPTVPTSPSLSDIPYADGGTCPAAICGYGTDSNGNPNPSSGEIQTIHGCAEGYITDTSLCDAVNAKAEQYGW